MIPMQQAGAPYLPPIRDQPRNCRGCLRLRLWTLPLLRDRARDPLTHA